MASPSRSRIVVRPHAGSGRGDGRGGERRQGVGLRQNKVTGGQVLAGRLPSRSRSLATTEQSRRHSFFDRRQVLGGADAGRRDGPAGTLPRVRSGGPSGRGAPGVGGARTAFSASARSAHGRRDHGRARAPRASLPLPPVPCDGDGPAARSDAGSTLQRDGDRTGLRDVWPVGREPSSDASAHRAVAFSRAGMAGARSMARRHHPRGCLRCRTALAAAMASAPAGRAGRGERAGDDARRGGARRTGIRRRRASRVRVTEPAEGWRSAIHLVGSSRGRARPRLDRRRARRGQRARLSDAERLSVRPWMRSIRKTTPKRWPCFGLRSSARSACASSITVSCRPPSRSSPSNGSGPREGIRPSAIRARRWRVGITRTRRRASTRYVPPDAPIRAAGVT